MDLTYSKTPIIVDIGSSMIKAGLSGQEKPSIVFPNILGEMKYQKVGGLLKNEEKKEIRIEAIKHLIGKWGLKNKEKKIINIIEKDNQNIGKIEEKTTLDENKMTKIQKESTKEEST